MTKRYSLKILTDFAASHSLRNYPGACQRMHGHNWKVEVEAVASKLDELGIGIDFKQMKKMTNRVLDKLDHYHLNDIPPFTEINPSAENIAQYIFTELQKVMNSDTVKLSAITVWETDRACVRYSED